MKKHESLCGYDFDGVIFDSGPLIAQDISKYLNREISVEDLVEHDIGKCFNLPEEQVREIIENFYKDKWFQDDHFISGALNGLNLMAELGHTINIITARPHPERVKEYLLQYIDIDPIQLNVYYTHSKDKGPKAQDLGMMIFIDDHFISLDSVAKCGVFPVLFDAPWNQIEHTNFYFRIKGWDEVKPIIEDL